MYYGGDGVYMHVWRRACFCMDMGNCFYCCFNYTILLFMLPEQERAVLDDGWMDIIYSRVDNLQLCDSVVAKVSCTNGEHFLVSLDNDNKGFIIFYCERQNTFTQKTYFNLWISGESSHNTWRHQFPTSTCLMTSQPVCYVRPVCKLPGRAVAG